MNNSKLIYTKKCKENIKYLKRVRNSSIKEISLSTNISETKLKNYFKEISPKYISKEMLDSISSFFQTTSEDLLKTSLSSNHNRAPMPNDNQTYISKIAIFLNNSANCQFTNHLHTWLFKLHSKTRTSFIDAFNSICSIFENSNIPLTSIAEITYPKKDTVNKFFNTNEYENVEDYFCNSPKVIQRLRNLQAEKNLSDRDVAVICHISYDTYKHIIRNDNYTQNIPRKAIELLASYYDCTIAYIIGDTNKPNQTLVTDNSGNIVIKEIMRPISFDYPKQAYEISDYLSKCNNDKFIFNLFCLVSLPDIYKTRIVNGINTFFEEYLLYAPYNKPNVNLFQYRILKDCISEYSPFCSFSSFYFGLAQKYFDSRAKRRPYKKALNYFFYVIYLASSDTQKYVKESIRSIKKLEAVYRNFPFKQLKGVMAKINSHNINEEFICTEEDKEEIHACFNVPQEIISLMETPDAIYKLWALKIPFTSL